MGLLLSISIVNHIKSSASPSEGTGERIDSNNIKCPCTESRIFDDNGLPYYNYSYVENVYIGLQRNPVTTANEALKFYYAYKNSNNPKNESTKQFFINNADWLVSNATIKQHNASYSYSKYEYTFPWPYYDLETPWRSGMAEQDVTIGSAKFKSNVIDEMLISGALSFDIKDQGITVRTEKRDFKIQFDDSRFRPSEVPILLSNAEKIKKEFGVVATKQIRDIINDQINYYLDGERRLNII